MYGGIAKRELADLLRESADVAAIAGSVEHFIHDGFYEPDAQPAFSLFMNEVIELGFLKSVDIKHLTVVHDFKNYLAFLGYVNVHLKLVIRIAMVGMNHQVTAHLIQGQNDLVQYHIRCNMAPQ